MARQLKRWESPRKEGRNDKGRGGSARQRQRKKQFQALRKKLKEQADSQDNKNHKNKNGEANQLPFSFGTAIALTNYCSGGFFLGMLNKGNVGRELEDGKAYTEARFTITFGLRLWRCRQRNAIAMPTVPKPSDISTHWALAPPMAAFTAPAVAMKLSTGSRR